MRIFSKTKDGGPTSPVDAYFLIELKGLFSIALLKFNKGHRKTFHTHAFDALTWFLCGDITEEDVDGTKVQYKRSLFPKVTRKEKNHRVGARKDSWCLTLRGSWDETWTEYSRQTKKTVTYGHGREIIDESREEAQAVAEEEPAQPKAKAHTSSVRPLPPIKRLHETLEYIPEKMTFRWKQRPLDNFRDPVIGKMWNDRHAGREIGTIVHKGGKEVKVVRLDKETYYHDDLLRFYLQSAPPEKPKEKAEVNSEGHPVCQVKRMYKNNTSGVAGVSRGHAEGTWKAYIWVSPKLVHLGTFNVFEEAVAARKSAEVKYRGKISRKTAQAS